MLALGSREGLVGRRLGNRRERGVRRGGEGTAISAIRMIKKMLADEK
jgi:hypothetical protein